MQCQKQHRIRLPKLDKVNTLKQLLLKAGPSVLAWVLSMAVPAVPAPVWLALINGLVAGNVTLSHITDFLKAHGIKAYPEDGYPTGKNGQFEEREPSASNINREDIAS
jgi:hypothetical protein